MSNELQFIESQLTRTSGVRCTSVEPMSIGKMIVVITHALVKINMFISPLLVIEVAVLELSLLLLLVVAIVIAIIIVL